MEKKESPKCHQEIIAKVDIEITQKKNEIKRTQGGGVIVPRA
jgi:hypothetical protein